MEQQQEQMKRLVGLAKKKDAHAFSLLYEMVYEDLFRMALYTLGNSHDAEDVVSDTVLDAYAQIHQLRDDLAFRGWIFRILSNKCKRKIGEYVKTREIIVEPKEEKDDTVINVSSSVDDMQNVLDREEIARAFQVVSREERLIVTMSVYGGYDSKEIAKILHMNRNTVRSKYKRALTKMRNELELGGESV